MLMIVPLMIWSARTEIDSQACSADTTTAASSASTSADQQRGRRSEDRPGRAAEDGDQVDAGGPADEGGHQHRAFDADVHDARSLAHDAAQRGEGDRHRVEIGVRGDDREDRDHVADELEDEPDDRDPVEELVHQAIFASPP